MRALIIDDGASLSACSRVAWVCGAGFNPVPRALKGQSVSRGRNHFRQPREPGRARKVGLTACLRKPFSLDDLWAAIDLKCAEKS